MKGVSFVTILAVHTDWGETRQRLFTKEHLESWTRNTHDQGKWTKKEKVIMLAHDENAEQMATKSEAFKDAPPTRKPSTLGCFAKSWQLSGLTEPRGQEMEVMTRA